ncbi:MAG: hypothetical protein F6K44_12210 [Moorea sp. SIO3E2]|nr:hypothetical protein [Moorena sp. SIO3E2]
MRASKAASNPSRPWVAPVEWASGVELASCQFQYMCGTGILPVPHIYVRAGRMPTLLLLIRRFSNAEYRTLI